MKKIEVKFEDVKDILMEKLSPKLDLINPNEEFILMEGFISSPYTTELSNVLLIGGPTIPLVMVFGKKTSLMYFFSYKDLMEE